MPSRVGWITVGFHLNRNGDCRRHIKVGRMFNERTRGSAAEAGKKTVLALMRGNKMPLVTFSSDSLPAALDDSARFKAWRDRYMEAHGLLEIHRSEDHPFSLRFTFAPYGEVGVGQFDGTISHVARTAHHVAASSERHALPFFQSRSGTRKLLALRPRRRTRSGCADAVPRLGAGGSFRRRAEQDVVCTDSPVAPSCAHRESRRFGRYAARYEQARVAISHPLSHAADAARRDR